MPGILNRPRNITVMILYLMNKPNDLMSKQELELDRGSIRSSPRNGIGSTFNKNNKINKINKILVPIGNLELGHLH